MAEENNPLRDLAELVLGGLWGRRDVVSIADRITDKLGIGEDDSPEAVEAQLRKALGLDTAAP